jgi:hypothetical protein
MIMGVEKQIISVKYVYVVVIMLGETAFYIYTTVSDSDVMFAEKAGQYLSVNYHPLKHDLRS